MLKALRDWAVSRFPNPGRDLVAIPVREVAKQTIPLETEAGLDARLGADGAVAVCETAAPQTAPVETNPEPDPFPVAGAADTFCALAFNHLQIAPNGTVKMCCIAGEDLHEGGRPLNVYVDGYDAIWNSNYMRSARRGLAEGERITPCSRCFAEEDTVGVSRRTTQNLVWAPEGKSAIVEAARANDWRVEDRPNFLQLNMGNLCNLACRMCSSQYSSRIASDDVHSRWIPDVSTDAARWKGNRLQLGPRPIAGIEVSGFHGYEVGPDFERRWTGGHGVIEFALPEDVRPQHLELDLEAAPMENSVVRILVNESELYCGEINDRRSITLDIAQIGNQPYVRIELHSDSVEKDGRLVGVLLHDACLLAQRVRRKSNARALTRFSENSGWWGQPSLMFDEILGQPDKLRYLILQGGEPLLIPETEAMLDNLIEKNCAGHVVLEIVSNMTTLKPTMLEKLKLFNVVALGGSIDGIGGVLEYIRYPAKWAEIEANLEAAKTAPNIQIQFNVAIQAYNLLDVPNLLAYCENHGYSIGVHFLVGPYYLSVLILPQSVRDLASQRIRDLRDSGVGPNVRAAADYALHFLEQHRADYRPDLMHAFMQFTNDMDQSRDQNFALALPELYDHIRASGFEWTDETRHLTAAIAARRPTHSVLPKLTGVST